MANTEMTDDELVTWLVSKLSTTLNEDGNEVSSDREENYNYYMGKPYGDERTGYSQVVTREAFEAVEWAMPSIMRAFTAGDRVVSFTPNGPNDEQIADQETDAVNYYLMSEADGFVALYEAIKEALMYPNSYLKVWMDEKRHVTTEQYQGVTQYGLVAITETEGVEIVAGTSYTEMTEQGETPLYDLKVKRTTVKPKLCVEAVAPEQLRVDAQATSLNLDECNFICHETQRSKTWLLENGYDEGRVEDLSVGDPIAFESEKINRLFTADENSQVDPLPGMEMYWVREIFCKIDFDGDGIAEQRRVLLVQDEVFENEEISYQPFVSLATMLNPHRHLGYSLLESVKDIQRISSTLMRQLLDNVYRLNTRRKYVGDGALLPGGATIEALMDPTIEIIPVSRIQNIEPEIVPSILGDILPVMQTWGDIKKVRTGVSPELSLDPSILKESTMGAFTNALENASQKQEMVVRLMAETGFKWLMLKIHRLLRENVDVAKMIRLRGKWVEVNPAAWPERTDVSVQVGLGFNSREKNIAAAMSLLQVQKEASAIGLAQPQNFYNALSKLVEAYGFKNVEEFFTPPDQMPQKGPDPQQQAMQADLQLQQQQLKIQQDAIDNDRARVQLEAKRQQMQIQEGMAKLQQKQQELEQSAEKQRTAMAKTLADIEQGWEKVNQGWAQIELANNRDLNKPGIGQ